MPSIGTHGGKFHCDEVFACFLLKSLPDFSDYDIIRTRDVSKLSNCAIVVDVGGEFDHDKLRYDHHQRDFTHTMSTLNDENIKKDANNDTLNVLKDFKTKLSSAGLIYAHYGKRVIAELLALKKDDAATVEILYRRLYEKFVEAIDAIDNGIAQYDGQPRYHLGGTLSSRVGNLNPDWNEQDVNADERFHEAMKLVGTEFMNSLKYLHKSWLPARDIVADSIQNRFEVDPSGQIILLDKGGVPWKEHFFIMEREMNLSDAHITYMVYEDKVAGSWRVQAIPIDEKSAFENRLPLPEAWRGYRNEELSGIANIPNCIFTHATGFIGGNEKREGAVEMARRSLQIANKYICKANVQ